MKYIDNTKKHGDKTEITHVIDIYGGWIKTDGLDCFNVKELHYVGKCKTDGDMFVGYCKNGNISVFKGIRGYEFD
jgi:hypothetical protein